MIAANMPANSIIAAGQRVHEDWGHADLVAKATRAIVDAATAMNPRTRTESDRDRAVESLLHPHADFTQAADHCLALDLIQLSIEGNRLVVPHLPHFHVA